MIPTHGNIISDQLKCNHSAVVQVLSGFLPRLAKLSLSDNETLGPVGVAAIAAALSGGGKLSLGATRLEYLSLRSCGVDTSGCRALAAALGTNKGIIYSDHHTVTVDTPER